MTIRRSRVQACAQNTPRSKSIACAWMRHLVVCAPLSVSCLFGCGPTVNPAPPATIANRATWTPTKAPHAIAVSSAEQGAASSSTPSAAAPAIAPVPPSLTSSSPEATPIPEHPDAVPQGANGVASASDVEAPAAPATAAPAAASPAAEAKPEPVAASSIDATVANLKGAGKGGDAAKLLEALGFDGKDLAALRTHEVKDAVLARRNLDADRAQEIVIRIEVDVGEFDHGKDDPAGMNSAATGTDEYMVIADVDGDRLKPIGRRKIGYTSCIIGGSFGVRYEPIHDPSFDDLVVELTTGPQCNGAYVGGRYTFVLTIERGKLEQILQFSAWDESSRGGITESFEGDHLQLVGKAPKVARVVDTKKRQKKVVRFDAAKFAYPKLQDAEEPIRERY